MSDLQEPSRDVRALSGDVTVFAIPNAHIDPVWIWNWREGMREVLATFRSAVDRLDEHDDLYFAASSASYYAWVEEMDPSLFARIKDYVASGRWELVGGEWIEPDCNIPCGESVCRQLLYAQRYFHGAFGRAASVAYNVDSFGHAGSLPQLFSKAGLDRYVMMRPQEHEHSIPTSLFQWEGIDGTSILTYRINEAYQTGLPWSVVDPTERDEEALIDGRATRLVALASDEMSPEMFFVGVGDHGGGPTRVAIRRVHELASQTGGAVAFASPSMYFEAAEAARQGSAKIPTVPGDLHMHAVGCYSAVSWIKVENAISEQMLVTAEKMASLCALTTGIDLDVQARLRSAWLGVLFNQFHDSLGGTCTEEAFDDLRQFYGFARTVADEVTTKATQLISARADTWIEGAEDVDRSQSANPFVAHFPVPVVVFNPLSWVVKAPIVMPHPAAAVTVGGGEKVPVQLVASREGTRYQHHGVVIAELPPLGYRVYWLHRDDPDSSPPPVQHGGAVGNEASLENEHLVVRVEAGRVTSMVSKATQREWLAREGIRPVVLEDASDTWSHGVVGYEAAEQECTLVHQELVESGPLRAKLRLTYSWQDSIIYEDVVLHAELDYVDIVLHVDWRQREQLVKLIVPLDVERESVTAGVPYGSVTRRATGQEEVMVHWLDVSSHEPASGVTCSSDSGYGYDATGSRLRFTVLRSSRYADHGQAWVSDDVIDQPATDQGWREVSYRVRPHDGPALSAPRQADEHCTSFPLVTETWHEGPLGPELAGAEVGPANVAATAFKRAEDGDGWIVRIVETAGRETDARLLVERLGRTWAGRLRGFEVVTLLLPDDASLRVREVPITELIDPELGDAAISDDSAAG